ncbi:exodeoxyribonuclease VII small subunit [Propionivibrio limicola]|uniref:exodeoxyribonuclease VII small subunit n=1 Tax=Propionivibrio limicola TaxID=167645 RepID=UPI0012910632|nr:exodeoxyribonuclease VII small subunit [Propionivibrio limicola]
MARPSTTDKARNDPGHLSPAPVSELKFEAAVTELEQIVQNMERGQLPLEESISAYHRGSELLMHCQQLLSDAERKIQILENGTLRDFEITNGESQ